MIHIRICQGGRLDCSYYCLLVWEVLQRGANLANDSLRFNYCYCDHWYIFASRYPAGGVCLSVILWRSCGSLCAAICELVFYFDSELNVSISLCAALLGHIYAITCTPSAAIEYCAGQLVILCCGNGPCFVFKGDFKRALGGMMPHFQSCRSSWRDVIRRSFEYFIVPTRLRN